MQKYEKLGAFYLGRLYDQKAAAPTQELLLYDAKDLTTHAVCVGMTGSGKTGLCVTLLEEAAIDGIPALIIDPKGDLGNLALTFPELRPSDFRPWIDEGEARRKGKSPDEHARDIAGRWKSGLDEWGQDGERIARLRSSAEVAIYTPGSSAGLPLTVLRSFAAPPPELLADADALRERIAASSSGLLALLGIDADPIRSREHILLSNLLQHAWQQERDLDIATLIREIQTPPFTRLGVVDLETFFPVQERVELAMRLNGLLASPGFAGWLDGDPLDVPRLLWTPDGKPRLSILSIAHLPEAERMFFVTILLNEVIAWMRTRPGTTSLRALLYMDEVFGYFPPTRNPPSKTPMLTLLKQARAYGLGVVLATQNPVDLDYKGLSNAGTWFLGRLQTERDKSRVLEGLEGASAAAGARFDRGKMEATLAGLQSRVFIMNNVHDDQPVLFHSRWALSYLRGPLTRNQIQILMAPRKQSRGTAPPTPPVAPKETTAEPSHAAPASERPLLPPGVPEFFIPRRGSMPEGGRLLFRPALLGNGRVHFVSAKAGIDHWMEFCLLAALPAEPPTDLWETAQVLKNGAPDLEKAAEPTGRLAALPAAATRPGSYKNWETDLGRHIYRSHLLTILRCAPLKQVSNPGESEGDFRVRLTQLGREQRDRDMEALRRRYAPKFAAIRERIRTAEERIGREESQYQQQKFQTAISLGATVIGALLGRKLTSVGNVGRATTAARGAGRAAREKGDVGRAREKEEALRRKIADLEADLEADTDRLREAADPATLSFDTIEVHPRKSDISIARVALVWTPWSVDKDGVAESAF